MNMKKQSILRSAVSVKQSWQTPPASNAPDESQISSSSEPILYPEALKSRPGLKSLGSFNPGSEIVPWDLWLGSA